MVLTTTSTIENKKITEYRGIVFGETVIGIDFVRDFGASITNFLEEDPQNMKKNQLMRELMQLIK